MTRDVRAVGGLLALLTAGTVATALVDAPAKGWVVLALVLASVVGLPLTARAVGRADWIALWALLVCVSVFQVLPDWILVDVVGTLRYPDIGGPRVGDAVNLAMGGMWMAPLFMALALTGARPGPAAVAAVGVFVGAEAIAPVIDLWEPVGDVWKGAGVAVYVLPAEAALAWATAVALPHATSWPRRIALAAAISTFYTGALVMGHFVLDVADWSLTT